MVMELMCIKAGDVITAIDGKGFKADEGDSSGPLRGAAGSTLLLTVVREGRDKPFDVSIIRETIRIASVRTRMLEPGYGYARISAFQADTAADFESQLEKLKGQSGGKLRGLVIDLRSNPGGLLTADGGRGRFWSHPAPPPPGTRCHGADGCIGCTWFCLRG